MPLSLRLRRYPHAQDLPLPTYASHGAAGLDLTAAIPQDVPLILQKGERSCIPTGFAVEIPPGYEGQVRPRSGLALTYGITLPNSPGTIDSDYRGEICVILMNLGQKDFEVRRGMRIAQLVIAPVTHISWTECDFLEQTKRGEQGFGSTGLSSKMELPTLVP